VTTIKLFDCTEDKIAPVMPEAKTLYSACVDIQARFHTDSVLVYHSGNQKLSVDLKPYSEMTGEPVDRTKSLWLHPGDRACVPTGYKMIIPHGYQIKLVPRSGMALKYGITLLNTPGTIDSDYTDELKVILYNASDEPYLVKEGDSIAQMELVVNNMQSVLFELTKDENELILHKQSSNREGGFGSTGR
jgi:dUTP pyrophosphatase